MVQKIEYLSPLHSGRYGGVMFAFCCKDNENMVFNMQYF
jgi:hypothetical protein